MNKPYKLIILCVYIQKGTQYTQKKKKKKSIGIIVIVVNVHMPSPQSLFKLNNLQNIIINEIS